MSIPRRLKRCCVFAIPLCLLAACGARQLPPDAGLREGLAPYERVIETSPDPAAVEQALAEEIAYLSHVGAGGNGERPPIAYLAAMEGLTQRLRKCNPHSPWLSRAWYHVGEGRRLSGDPRGALGAYENAVAMPCEGASGVYSALSLERIEEVTQAIGDPAPGVPADRLSCPPEGTEMRFPPARPRLELPSPRP